MIATFDVVVGMHLIDLTQLFVYDAPKALIDEMASEDRSIHWQRMELTAAAIVTTLRGMRYEGGGGQMERLATASLIEDKRKTLGSELFISYLAQRRREKATLDHRQAFPHTTLYTNASSKHQTLEGSGSYPAEQVHSNPSVRHTVPESEDTAWSRVSAKELVALLNIDPDKLAGQLNDHPLFASSLSDGKRHHLRAQIATRAIEEDTKSEDRFKKAHTLLFVPLQEGIPVELSILRHNETLDHVDNDKIPVLAIECNPSGIVETLWLCNDPGEAVSSLVLAHTEHVELCSCAMA